jgi:hypothetical protein
MTIPVWFQDWYNNGSGGIAAAAQTYIDRVEADGGNVESIGCVPSAVWNWAAPLLLLDLYPNAAAAYSLRKLRTAYSGNAIRVRKEVSAVSSETDIGFLGDGSLDTTTLLTFASDADGGNVFVVTWYDQSLSNDATQSAGANQPKIVSSGAVITEGTSAKPAIDFDGVDDGMLTSGISLSASTISLSVVYTNGSTSGQKNIIRQRANGAVTTLAGWSWEMGLNTSTTQYGTNTFVDDGSGSVSATASGQGLQDLIQHNEFLIFKNSEILAYQDSLLNETLNTTTGTTPIGQVNVTQPIWLGRNFGDNSREYDGTMQEVILFYSNQSSNRTGIETNINTFYSIYP